MGCARADRRSPLGKVSKSMALGITWARAWVARSADVIAENRVALITLDRAIGDGDHGENLDRGYSAVVKKIADLPEDASPADALKLVATTLISTVGGASGPLFGTAYLKAAGAVAGKNELDGAAIVDLLTAARDGIVLRGKAEVGDKDRKSTRLNSSHLSQSRMPSSA